MRIYGPLVLRPHYLIINNNEDLEDGDGTHRGVLR